MCLIINHLSSIYIIYDSWHIGKIIFILFHIIHMDIYSPLLPRLVGIPVFLLEFSPFEVSWFPLLLTHLSGDHLIALVKLYYSCNTSKVKRSRTLSHSALDAPWLCIEVRMGSFIKAQMRFCDILLLEQ